MNRNSKPIHNLYTHKIPITKLAVKKLQYAKFYATLLVLVVLVGAFSISPAISSLINDVILRSTGTISSSIHVVAESGSAIDIQTAVNEVVAAGGIGDVHIPAGTFNFVEIGEPWMTVDIPAGVNLYGAPTERTSGLPVPSTGLNPNDQVVEWKTVLVMPYDVPDNTWFYIDGSGDPTKSSRFSDIKLVGYRSIDSSDTWMHYAIGISQVMDFRVDHCYFEHTTQGVSVAGGSYPNCRGVFDHNVFINEYGIPQPYDSLTVGYGIGTGSFGWEYWEDDITNVIGKYNDNTVFIEDNYFKRWRHSVSSLQNAHYVFRYNTIENDYGMGSIDAHGSYATSSYPNNVGTRAVEIYNNAIISRGPIEYGIGDALRLRGGAGVVFDNYVDATYNIFIEFQSDAGNDYQPKCKINDMYVWNNTANTPTFISNAGDAVEGVNYFLRAPNLAEDGWEYTPYVYPHPLALEETP